MCLLNLPPLKTSARGDAQNESKTMKTLNRLNWGFISIIVLDFSLLWTLVCIGHHLIHYRLMPWQK